MNNEKEKLTNKEFARRLEERTKRFAVSIIKLSSKLSKTSETKIICNQIVKSGTSIGANYREANRSVSSADFRNKISICTKEASETQYWLELLIESGIVKNEENSDLIKECDELIAIFTATGKSAKRNVKF